MTSDVLETLLAGNHTFCECIKSDQYEALQPGQSPDAVTVCCSDSRVPQTDMWNVDDPGYLFTPSNIGNVTWNEVEEERVVDGNVAYPLEHTDTHVAVVVGHTGCGAITAAYEQVTSDTAPSHPGISTRIDLLEPVIQAGLDSDRVNAEADTVVDQLVEYNVREQVAFLAEETDATVYGFVFDLHCTYGDTVGQTYLVATDETTDLAAMGEEVPDEYVDAVGSVLEE